MPENTTSPTTRPGQERFVIADDEIGLGAVDAVADESAPASSSDSRSGPEAPAIPPAAF